MNSSTDPPDGTTSNPWTLSVMERGYWQTWLNSMSPERLAQQRAYDNERGKKYYQENKEERQAHHKQYYERNKERYSEKHACEICGGRYTTSKRAQHCKTKKHQHATQGV